MSQTIDSRVVEMKFDNKNFEKNVAESMKTLDQLSKRVDKLEDTQVDFSKMQKAANSFDLSKMDKALDSITHRFSIMGQVGASVISNITTDAYNMVKSFGSKVWGTVFGQMKTGGKARAENVENAKFLLEGMGITYGKEVEDQISDAVADTAFGFDEAAMAMAQLSGASVQLGDDMDKALKGISGVAAMTNRSFSDIADIFVDAAATGKVSADTFNRLSERGLAAKGIMQEFYGVNATELDKLAKKGAISFNDFSKAMYDAFGTQAKKSNETLTGVIANTKAVLSRMGQSFYQPLMANNSDVVKFFQQLKDTLKGFEGPVKEIGKQLSGYVLNLAKYGTEFLKKIDVAKFQPVLDNISKTFENLYFAAQNLYSNILKPFGKIFKDALYEVFPSLNTGKSLLETISIKIKDASERFRQFTADIGLFGEKGASVKDVLVSIFNALKTGATILKSFTTLAKAAVVVVASFLKEINFGGMLKGLTRGIAEFANIGLYLVMGIAEGLKGGVPVLFSAIAEVGKMIVSAFCAFFGIASPSKTMRDKVGYWLVAGIAEGMKKALAAGLIVGAIALVMGVILSKLREGEETLTATASRLFDGFINKIADVIDRISKWFAGTGIGKAFASGLNLITVTLNKLADGISKFDVTKFKELISVIKQMIILGGYIYVIINFAAASTLFTNALWNLSRAAKFYMNSMQIKYFGATLKNLAIAIGVITASIVLFAGMIKAGDWEELLAGVITIGLIITALVLAVTKIKGAIQADDLGTNGIIKVEAMFIGMAASIYLIASAIRKIGKLDPPQLAIGLVGIIGLVIALGAFVIAMQKLADKSGFEMEKAWLTLIGIGVSVRLIAGAIKSLAKIESTDKVWTAVKQISVIVVLLGAISVLTQVFSKLKSGQLVDNISNMHLPAMFLALGVAVNLIARAIRTVSEIKPKELEQGKSVMREVMLWFVAMLGVSIFASNTIGIMLLGFAAAIAGVAIAVKLIGEMESGVQQGIEALIGLMFLIAGLVGAVNIINKMTGGYGDSSGTRALMYAGICIAAMGAVVKLTGSMSISEIFKGMMVISALSFFVMAIGLLFGLANRGNGTGNGTRIGMKQSFFDLMKGKASKFENTVKTIWAIRSIVSALIKLALVVVVMSKVIKDYDQLTLAITTMAGVMGILAIVLVAAGELSERCPNLNRITKPIVALTGALLVIAGSLVLLGSMPDQEAMGMATLCIVAILGLMGYVLEKSKVFGVQGMNVKGILACAVGIIAISAALTLMIGAIGDLTPEKFGTVIVAVAAISGVLLAIAYAMKIADKVKIRMKSVAALILSTLSLVMVAATIALFAYYVEDMNKAIQAAGALAVVMIGLGTALKLSESVKWSAAGALLAGALTLVAAAYALSLVAGYNLQELLPSFMALVGIVTIMAGILAALTLLADTGIGAAGIVIVAAAIAILSASLIGMAIAMELSVDAMTKFVALFTKETASNIVGFFETIGDGIGTAGQHIADGLKTAIEAFRSAFAVLNQEGNSAGADFVGGFVSGIIAGNPFVAIAAIGLGALAVSALRSDKGIDAHSDSWKTIAAALDFVGGFTHTIEANSTAAEKPAETLGANAVNALSGSISKSMESVNLGDIWKNVKAKFTGGNEFKWYEWFGAAGNGARRVVRGITETYAASAFDGAAQGVQQAASNATSSLSEGGGILGSLTSFLGGGTGDFSTLLDGFDFSKVLGEGGISELGKYLGDAGASMDNLSGDNIPKLIERLKEAGLAGDDLTNALKELGITQEQLESLGLADTLGLGEAKEGAEELKTTIQDLADEIIKGKFGNAPERWDKMFESLIKSGKTAEEAYAAIADAQNEVNKRLGSSVVHTADEMSKKVSESVKKANQAQAEANAKAKGETTSKAARDFKAEPFKSDSTVSKSDAKSAAEQQMLNNMPYENVKLAKEKQITAEREKQTVEAYKQKLANEHMYTLAEKQEALKNLKANEEIARQANLTTEKKKQLDAENARYQKVVDTYDEQQKMLKSIQDQEAATKKAEDAEKKRGDAVKASAGAVVYGTEEYYKQTGKSGMTINTMPAKKVEETKPVEAKTKVEVTPEFEVKNADTTKIKSEVITKVETEFKDLQAKATITPKIDTAQAETAIKNLKTSTQDLKTTIPQTFQGMAADVGKHISNLASTISQEGSKIVSNTKSAFQKAVDAAVNTLTGTNTITRFTNAGKNATQGYANGIRNNLELVRKAGVALANTAIKATKTAQKSNSPSKIFTQLGEWNGEGYGNGMINSIGYVVKASDQMANASIDEMSKVVNAVQSSLAEGFDVEPTIVPVIDVSEIQNNLDYINSTFGQQQTMDILADIEATKAFRNQETESMQSQMDNLRGDLSILSDALLNQPTPEVTANVVLQGDADGVFKLVQNSNNRYTKMHGKSAFA